jgi:hypothetical protein
VQILNLAGTVVAGSQYSNDTRYTGNKVQKWLHVLGVRVKGCDVRSNGIVISSVQPPYCLSVVADRTQQGSSLQSAARSVGSTLIETEHNALLSAVISASNVAIFDLITLVTFCAIWRSLLLAVAIATAADCLSMYCRRLMGVVMTLTV